MQRISHKTHITPESIPDELTDFIIKRFQQLAEETDTPPIIILVNPDDDITGPDFAFIGNRGLLSDLYEEHAPGEAGFVRPFEWVSHWPELGIYEALLLQDPDNGYWILIPEATVEINPDLKWVLTAPELGGLSEPQPLLLPTSIQS